MADAATLVVELLTEELPPKALRSLGETFAATVRDALAQRGFIGPSSALEGFATPRRLAARITGVLTRSPDTRVIQRLMPANVALDASGPTNALRKKLTGMGRAALADAWRPGGDAADGADRIYVEHDGKADAVFLSSVAPGQPLERGLAEALDAAIAALPIPKVMSYASAQSPFGRNDVHFVRPAHRLLALHGPDVVPVRCERLQLTAGRTTAGHRFMSRQDLDIATAAAYDETLQAEGKVVPSFAARRNRIVAQLERAADGAVVIRPDALLDEVTGLVEWPAVYAGSFDEAFLAVPQECLILTMQQNQKYFALAGPDGRLRNRFLVVSNLETRHSEAIVQGNERVLRARLSDARFFYDQDRRVRLEERVPKLAGIVYHNRLGTLGQRAQRIEALAGSIAQELHVDVAQATRAARLAKADLVTDMVGEFPELQGLMGRYYAQHDGEPASVARAIEQHYWPRFAGDALPEHGVAQAVALADKLEALAGLFGIGAQPTGDKDPFGLRRAALGVLRILIEREIALPLDRLLALAFETLAQTPGVRDARDELAEFMYDRLRGYLRERGYSANQIAAVVDSRPGHVHLVPSRLAAVQSFEALPEAGTLAAANKRIVNILRKAEAEARSTVAVDRARLAAGAEQDLYAVFQELEPVVETRCASGDYAGALVALATAKPAVDRFFDDVMVMADDPGVRANRLALLRDVASTMNRVADISKLAV